MNNSIFRIGVLILLIGIGYFLLQRYQNKKPGEYIWVGNGEDPFKEKKEE